jgi:hypothetical protein
LVAAAIAWHNVAGMRLLIHINGVPASTIQSLNEPPSV